MFYTVAGQCFHHYDDFIVPKSGWFMSKWKSFRGEKDELRAMSMKQYLQCYSDACTSPPTLRRMLCQNVSAAIEDISCKLSHLKDGYSCPMHGSGRPEPVNESNCYKLNSVRAKLCLVLHLVLCSNAYVYSFCRHSRSGFVLSFIAFIAWLGNHLLQQKQLNFS